MNVPNILSLIRLAMVPLVPLVYFSDIPYANLCAAGIYAAASLTDVLDGYIARRYNLITRLGRILDPLADKCMTFCVLICIIITEPALIWAGVIFFFKEICMGLGALVQYKKIADVPPSKLLGKLSTAVFFSICFLVLLFPDMPRPLLIGGVAAAIALSLLAFIFYFIDFIKNVKHKPKTE